MKVYKGRSEESSKKELKQNSALRTEVFRFFFYFATVQRQAKFQKTGIKCLHF